MVAAAHQEVKEEVDTPTPTLDTLPAHILLDLCIGSDTLGGCDLAALEAVARHFRLTHSENNGAVLSSGEACTVLECAAERRVCGHKDGWRLYARPEECWKYVLAALEDGVLAPLPVVSAGTDFSMVCAARGQIFAFGRNERHQLGLGNSNEMVENNSEGMDTLEASPREVERLRGRRVVGVASGEQHTAALSEEGALLTWGDASDGRLGHGPVPAGTFHMHNVVAAPKMVTAGFPQGTRVALVAAGDTCTACISTLGEVFSWGQGRSGQLGHGDKEDQHIPKRVEALAEQRVVGLVCGQGSSVAVTAGGEVFIWGTREEDTAIEEEILTPELVTFPNNERVRHVSCGGDMFAAVDIEGTLFTWGNGGMMGHGDEGDYKDSPTVVAALVGQRVTVVSCGMEHVAAVTEEGQLWTWGNGDYVKLGSFDPYVHRYAPTCVNRSGLDEDCGGLPGGEAAVVRSVSCGSWHTVVVMASGEVCTFGNQRSGGGGLGRGPHCAGWPSMIAALPSLDEASV